MAKRSKIFRENLKRLKAEGKHEEVEQMKQADKDAKRVLKEIQRERQLKIKKVHKASGYYKKKPRKTVSGGTMSGK